MRIRARWADITTCMLVSAATIGFVAAVFEGIPA